MNRVLSRSLVLGQMARQMNHSQKLALAIPFVLRNPMRYYATQNVAPMDSDSFAPTSANHPDANEKSVRRLALKVKDKISLKVSKRELEPEFLPIDGLHKSPSAYQLFVAKRYEEAAEEGRKVNLKDICNEFKNISSEEHENFVAQSQKLRESAAEQFKLTLHEMDPVDTFIEKHVRAISTLSRGMHRHIYDDRWPSKPLIGRALFLKENLASIRETYNCKSIPEAFSKTNELFAELSESEKETYEKRAQKVSQLYADFLRKVLKSDKLN